MKKEAFILSCLCAFSMSTWATRTLDYDTAPVCRIELDNVPTGNELIELRGDLMYGTSPNAIQARTRDNIVYLQFNQSFGNINVLIYNSTGCLVYSNTVDTSVLPTLIIPMTGNDNGTYLIELNNVNGYAEGEFEKKSNP